jgi:nucleoside-diphosphate-sugar epimerase
VSEKTIHAKESSESHPVFSETEGAVKKILVTGSTGQIGSELTPALRERYGADNVVAAGHSTEPAEALRSAGPYAAFDIRDKEALEQIVSRHDITVIYHLAALLSAVAEERPQLAWDININGLINVLEAARRHGCSVFHPSSIGAFGPSAPRDNTPQETIQRPKTIYGVTKVSGELLGDYYFSRYGVDCRGVRYPGLISHETPPGGGTTDYAVEIFHAALREKKYTCYLSPETRLDMMYMPDAIRAAIGVMEADGAGLSHRNAFNVTAMSLTPAELHIAIGKHIPDFTIDYAVDPVRQAIADSWPDSMDDSAARGQWGWRPEYDLEAMTKDMLARLADKLAAS